MRLKTSIFFKNVVYNFVSVFKRNLEKLKVINKLKLMDALKLWSVLSGTLFCNIIFTMFEILLQYLSRLY